VIVRNLDALGAGRGPTKANAVLIIDADAVLTGAIAL
jgi:hypothetical protein